MNGVVPVAAMLVAAAAAGAWVLAPLAGAICGRPPGATPRAMGRDTGDAARPAGRRDGDG